MGTAKRCPGCSRPVAATEHWCGPCHLRLPEQLRRAVEDAERALRARVADAHVWLDTHPHATDRELDVIGLASQGLENTEIADQLHVSVHTVRDCWRNLSKRWGCSGRAHIIATAFRLGYLSVQDGPERKKATA
ncbi:LuxR C-terminal-related transcriptional regulator [Nocardiopsis lucentensis]|uniref:LuxR C-terminal-related transcriptional regulator n=1 Tax=Nocardiopsis lucentensis TaxID=53441 RepID=UPI000349A791|nr:LuxR C-terminal-related transcriptional regulator [Nocardiopsis lucentensis]